MEKEDPLHAIKVVWESFFVSSSKTKLSVPSLVLPVPRPKIQNKIIDDLEFEILGSHTDPAARVIRCVRPLRPLIEVSFWSGSGQGLQVVLCRRKRKNLAVGASAGMAREVHYQGFDWSCVLEWAGDQEQLLPDGL